MLFNSTVVLEREALLYGLIVACEVAFWLLLLLGLIVRYLLRRARLGGMLLVAVPLVDLILLIASVMDLRDGGTAGFAHGVAAVYIGVTVAWGPAMVRWADARFAHRFAGAPPPSPPPKVGRALARHEQRQALRHLLAWGIGTALLAGGGLLVGDSARAEPLLRIASWWTLVLAIDLVWSFSYTLRARGRRSAH